MTHWQVVMPQVVAMLIVRYGSARAAALALGVDPAQLSRWQHNGQEPSVAVLQRIADGCPDVRSLIHTMF